MEDLDGTPAAGAKVRAEVMNYGEFSPIAIMEADKNGCISFETGFGSLLICAVYDGAYGEKVIDTRAVSYTHLLLCDEATSALDPQTTSSILELLQDINQKFGITIVIITHQMSVVREICTHVAIMKDGEVKEQGLVEEIFSHPKSQVAKELISKDSGNDVESKKLTQSEIQDGEIVRIVFSENSAFEPVIANLILTFHEPVNILKANTKNVGGVAKGEMILQFMSDSTNVPEMKKFLTERGLEIGEAN